MPTSRAAPPVRDLRPAQSIQIGLIEVRIAAPSVTAAPNSSSRPDRIPLTRLSRTGGLFGLSQG
jgi:hypothetical protein